MATLETDKVDKTLRRKMQQAHQLRLSTSKQFVELLQCTLGREEALKIMQSNPPSTGRLRH
jgi:hypothetical protein